MIEIENMRDGYLDIAREVLRRGSRRAPRGFETTEVLSEVIRLADPRDSLPRGVNRNLNAGIAAIEALQLIGGFSDPTLVCKISPQMAEFMDDGAFHGSYGLRTGWQMSSIIERLKSDRDTRRAVLAIWDARQDLQDGLHDYPCTTRLTFSIVDDKLVLETSMRSNDVWLGLAYDIFQFTQLQLVVADCLQVEVGPYLHHATSLHVYDRDLKAINELTSPDDDPRLMFEAIAGAPGHIESYQQRAWDLVYNDPNPRNETEKWMMVKLARYQ